MKYYLDITLLPDADANLGFLWQKIYGQVHLALVEMKTTSGNSDIAVSFPEYGDKKFSLGNKLRLFASTHTQLQQLDIGKWLTRLNDYSRYTSTKEVPQSADRYANFKRKQFKSNITREAERRAKYKNESLDEALEHFKNYEKKCLLPFVNVVSLSTVKDNAFSENKRFKLFVERKFAERRVKGEFSCYGLSKNATVPWF